jgi:uncharacterized protein DUF6438
MRKFAIFAVLAVVMMLAVIVAVFPAAAQDDESVITLERTPCFGACPIYAVTIHADGSVEYDGKRFVDVTGEQTANIGAEAFDELMQVIENAGYFDWDDEYTDLTVTDASTVTTTVTRDGETKTIRHYLGDGSAPLGLSFLENWIDMAAGTQQWTGAKPYIPGFTSAGSAVVTLERGACFGTCPMYKLVIYEDGTVVFSGYRFVGEMGIQIGQIDPEDVKSLVKEIADAGYFDLDDEYTDQSVTDLPTVMISVMGDEGYKEIVHYLGDNSAPESLTQIEESIDAAVNVSQWITPPEATKTPES